MRLSSAGRTALWIGGGGFLGLAIGALLVSPGRALSLSPAWFVAAAVYVGLVIGLARERDATQAPRPASAQQPAARPPSAHASPDALAVRFEFPEVPPGYPLVLGRGEPLHVTIKVLHAGAPAEGAGVQLSASLGRETLTGDGVTGSTGEVEFTLEPEGTGELQLKAEASADGRSGRGHVAVSVVEYDVEIERLFGEFRAYAVGVLGPEAESDTARELCDKLRVRADPATARALLELARVYELVAYGERDADRRLYLTVLEQLMVLEQAELPDPALAREA
ncbi:MAG TPA: DUF4129 domain-containing protein [Candidatus Thermoplasmatota archaeon]|nr:DUF4129 domain-containing protein [Candidatus Thermoplasmatota archaeon]